MIKTSASQSVELKFIFPSRVIPKDSKMAVTTSLLGAQRSSDGAMNQPACLFVVSLGKAHNGMPPSLCGRQVAGRSSLPVVVPQCN